MTTNDRHENETNPSQPLLTPGAILKAARERKGLSQQDVANRLNLRLTLIRDIEEDRFDLKTASTFTKGYLKTYAHFVGVDEHAVLEAYDRLGIKEQQYSTTMYSFSGRTKREASETRVRVISWVLCIGLIVAGGVWWWRQPAEESVPTSINEAGQLVLKDTQKDDKQAAPSPDAAPVEASNEGADKAKAANQTAQAVAADETGNNTAANQDESGDNQATDPNAASDQDNQDTSVLSNSAAQGPTEAQSAVPAASHPADAPVTAAPDASSTAANTATTTSAPATDAAVATTDGAENSNATMVVQFTGPCWLRITDANGKSLLEGTRKAGDKAELSGTEPFHLTIGAPRVVNITFHGQPVDMSSYIRRGVVARYQLPIKS